MKTRKVIKRILYIVGAIVITYAAWNLLQIHQSTVEAQRLYEELARQAREAAESRREALEAAAESAEAAAESEEEAPPPGNEWLTELQSVNEDLVGWIRIPNTNIDYPVMQTKADGEYYLHRNFERKEQSHGTPYLDANCTIGTSENLVIYGHHMKDGTMFQNLMKFQEPDFCENNGEIFFSTPEETFTYRVYLVMIISSAEAKDFPYYLYSDLSDEDAYREYLARCGEYAVWTDDETVESGTPLLTLSTCEYSKNNGRLVVIARCCEG